MVFFFLAAAFLLVAPPGGSGVQAGAEAHAEAPAVNSKLLSAPPVNLSLRSLLVLLDRAPATTAAARTAKPRATAVVHTLLSLTAKGPAHAPVDYRAQLDKEVRILERALTSADATHLDRTIQALADDLEIKLEHGRQSGGWIGGSVTVRVRTWRGADALSDAEVFYISALHEAGGIPPERLPKTGGVSKAVLVPGRYMFWVRDPVVNVMGEPTPVKVGEGRRELDLDLLAPAPAAR